VDTAEKLLEFQSLESGIPLLVEADPDVFDFADDETFTVSNEKICEIIYGFKNTDYIGFKHAFVKNRFLSVLRVKKKLQNEYSRLVDHNLGLLDSINKLKCEQGLIGAFQTRNIPHYGHELIIEEMLKTVDHVVINPVIGPKKYGDVKLQALDKVYTYLADKKYRGRISFFPIFANMYYAGPREAVHHAKLRSKLKFDLFSVGRDHAGADGKYEAAAAAQAVEKFKDKLGIKILAHRGAARCVTCDKYVLIGSCGCSGNNLIDIAGTEFRNALGSKCYFEDADLDMQQYLFESKVEMFET
jgi:sulfate adenylyltransferase